MKKTLALLLVLVGALSCKKKDTCSYDACAIVAPQSESNAVQAYLTQNGLTAAKHCSGAYYRIVSAGTGDEITSCSTINASYDGRFTSGARFDSGTTDFSLQSVIRGWTNLIPLVRVGGHILLYIPPSLGYGASNYGTIPGNSILVFDVTVNALR